MFTTVNEDQNHKRGGAADIRHFRDFRPFGIDLKKSNTFPSVLIFLNSKELNFELIYHIIHCKHTLKNNVAATLAA